MFLIWWNFSLKIKQKTKITIFFIHFLVFQSYFLKTNTTNSNHYLHGSLEGCHLCEGSRKILCRYIPIFTTWLTTTGDIANCVWIYTCATDALKNAILIVLNKIIKKFFCIASIFCAKALTMTIRNVAACFIVSRYKNLFSYCRTSTSLADDATYEFRS